MGNDRELFDEDRCGIPLYEGRMVSHYDHRAKGYKSGRGRAAEWKELAFSDSGKSIQPQWYISPSKIPAKLGDRIHWFRVAICAIASPTNERSLCAALIPGRSVCGHSLITLDFGPEYQWALPVWLAVANSFTMDFVLRQKVALNVTFTILDSLPFPRPRRNDPLIRRLIPLSLQLTCTGPEMVPFWNQMAADGWVSPCQRRIPGELDEDERLNIRAEIDAIVARDFFDLTREEVDYILATFPTQKRYQEEKYGEFRSRRLILEHYDTAAAVKDL